MSLHTVRKRRRAGVLEIGLTITLAMFLSVTAYSQTSNCQTAPPDLINPDRPGIADGSTVVDPQVIQIESGTDFEFRRNGASREHTLFIPTLLRLGLMNHLEARIEGNTFTRVRTFESGSPTDQVSGFAPTSIGLKYQFYDSGEDHQLTLGTIARVFPPWGSNDFRTQHTTGDLRLAADWKFSSKFSLNPNVGIARYENDEGKLFTAGQYAVTLNYLPTLRLNPFVDVAVQSPEVKDGSSSAIVDGGLAYAIRNNLELDASVGTRVHGITAPRPFLAFGISWRTKHFHRQE